MDHRLVFYKSVSPILSELFYHNTQLVVQQLEPYMINHRSSNFSVSNHKDRNQLFIQIFNKGFSITSHDDNNKAERV